MAPYKSSLSKHSVAWICSSSLIGFIILGLLIETQAQAQSVSDAISDLQSSVTLTPSDLSLNILTCEAIASEREFTLSGTYNSPSINYTTRLIATLQNSCSHTDVCNPAPLDEGECSCLKELTNSATLSTTFTINDLFNEPCVEGVEQTVSFFLHYAETESANPLGVGGLAPVENESQAVQISIDLNAPDAPTAAPSVTPAEEALVINAPEVGGDVVRYEACVWIDAEEEREDARCITISGGNNDRFEGLINNKLYNVAYVVYDDADNPSGDSPITQGTPTKVLDFAEVYSGEYPGGERGGCQGSRSLFPQPIMLILIVLMTLGMRRKYSARQKIPGCLLAALIITSALAPHTHAQSLDMTRSERNTTVSLLGGSYQPRIDEEFAPAPGVKRPYERIFQDQSPLMLIVQLERHLLQSHGVLSVGGSFGYWSVEGEGLSVTTTTETTEMAINPFALYASYRFDLFQDLIPLLPTLKVGVNYYTWSIYDGSGDVASFADGSEASGGTAGWFYSIGFQFLLDFLDREMAWAFDRDAGVNHSYISFEYQSSRVDDFGDPDSFRLGNDLFLFGLTLDL